MIELNKTFKISKRLVLNAGGNVEVVYGNNVPENYTPAIGGIYSRQNSIKFWAKISRLWFWRKWRPLTPETP